MAMAGARLLEVLIKDTLRHPLPWVLAVQALAVTLLTAILISSLLLPIPPQPDEQRQTVGPFLADPVPPAALARVGVRE
jgi:hypothetical protein